MYDTFKKIEIEEAALLSYHKLCGQVFSPVKMVYMAILQPLISQ